MGRCFLSISCISAMLWSSDLRLQVSSCPYRRVLWCCSPAPSNLCLFLFSGASFHRVAYSQLSILTAPPHPLPVSIVFSSGVCCTQHLLLQVLQEAYVHRVQGPLSKHNCSWKAAPKLFQWEHGKGYCGRGNGATNHPSKSSQLSCEE